MAAPGLDAAQSSPEVLKLQQRLKKLGFNVPTNGAMDRKTLAAAQALATKIGYKQSMKDVDAAFLKALDAFEKRKFYKVVLNGKTFVIDEYDYAKLRKTAGEKWEKAMRPHVLLAERAYYLWKFDKENKDNNWFIGSTLELWSRAKMPDEMMMKGAMKAAENLCNQARALTLTPEIYRREVRKIEEAAQAIDIYRDKLFGGGESLISTLTVIRDGSVVTLGVLGAIATGGASLGAQAAMSSGVAGFGQVLKEIETVGNANYNFKAGAGRVLLSMTVDAAASMILKGPKGKDVIAAVSKSATARVPKVMVPYITRAIEKGGVQMIEDGIKGIPKLLDPNEKLTFESVVKAGVSSFLIGISAGPLGDKAEAWVKKGGSLIGKKELLIMVGKPITDQHALEGLKKTIDATAQGAVALVLSKWDPKRNPAEFDKEVTKAIAADPKVKAAAKKAAAAKK